MLHKRQRSSNRGMKSSVVAEPDFSEKRDEIKSTKAGVFATWEWCTRSQEAATGVACGVLLATVAAATILAVVVIKHKKSSYVEERMPMPPGVTYNAGNYTHAMQLALTFLDIQKSGKLPASFLVP